MQVSIKTQFKAMTSSFYILEKGFGDYRLLPGTREEAMRLYYDNAEHLPSEVKALLAYWKTPKEARTVTCASPESLIKGLGLVLGDVDKRYASHLRFLMYGPGPSKRSDEPDTRPEAEVTAEMRAEALAWAAPFVMGQRDSSWATLVERCIKKGEHPELALSFLAPFAARVSQGRPIQWSDLTYRALAEEARIIEEARWNPDAKEERIVQRILAFIDEQLTHRDVSYTTITRPAE